MNEILISPRLKKMLDIKFTVLWLSSGTFKKHMNTDRNIRMTLKLCQFFFYVTTSLFSALQGRKGINLSNNWTYFKTPWVDLKNQVWHHLTSDKKSWKFAFNECEDGLTSSNSARYAVVCGCIFCPSKGNGDKDCQCHLRFICFCSKTILAIYVKKKNLL